MILFLAGLRGLSWILPRIAAARALRLFLTSTRVPRPSSEKEYYDSALKFEVLPGMKAYEWGNQNGPLAILLHGWNGRGTQMGPFVAPLLERGFRVVALDGPAHGDSAGETTNVGAYADFLVAAQKVLGEVDVVIAHSMGAGCCVLALERGLQIKRMVLISGPSRYEWIVKNFFKFLKISPRAQSYFIELLTQKIGVSPLKLNMSELIHRRRIPTFIIHDRDDKEVAFSEALEIQKTWPDVRFLATTGLGHRRILKSPEVHAEVGLFLDQTGKLK